MLPSPYDDGWLLDLLAVEIRLNDPRVVSSRELPEQPLLRTLNARPINMPIATKVKF
jgi:hypothetical protein